ncbi:hypothetical protein BOX15_Mlig017377g1, partial [Macrostomum lignano]
EHRSQLQTEDARAKGRTGKAFNAPIMRDIEPVLSSLLKLLRPGMPKVVPDQWRKFQHDDLLKQLAEDNPIAYSPHRDRPAAERRSLMHQELREGFITVAVCNMGLTLRLVFDSTPWTPKPNGQRQVTSEEVRLDNSGRIRLKSRFILNGVCVQWQGYMDSNSLSGRGRIVFDADRAEVENQLLRDQLMEYHRLHSSCYAMSTAAAAGATAAAATAAATATVAASTVAAAAAVPVAAGASGGGSYSVSHHLAQWPMRHSGGAESPTPPPPPPTPLCEHEQPQHPQQQQSQQQQSQQQQSQQQQSLSPSAASGSEEAGES